MKFTCVVDSGGFCGGHSVALRWRGRLREDPMALPWGQRFEIDLEQVEAAGVVLPVSGGLRVKCYSGGRAAEPPGGLRAGDRVEARVKARAPRNFRDPGREPSAVAKNHKN